MESSKRNWLRGPLAVVLMPLVFAAALGGGVYLLHLLIPPCWNIIVSLLQATNATFTGIDKHLDAISVWVRVATHLGICLGLICGLTMAGFLWKEHVLSRGGAIGYVVLGVFGGAFLGGVVYAALGGGDRFWEPLLAFQQCYDLAVLAILGGCGLYGNLSGGESAN